MVNRISCSTVSSKNASAFDTVCGVGVTPEELWLQSRLAVNGEARRDRQNNRQEGAWLHCLFSVNDPDPIEPPHEFEPV